MKSQNHIEKCNEKCHGWRLQAQTNDLTQGLGTNWVDVANSTITNQMTLPINPASGSVFYRMINP